MILIKDIIAFFWGTWIVSLRTIMMVFKKRENNKIFTISSGPGFATSLHGLFVFFIINGKVNKQGNNEACN